MLLVVCHLVTAWPSNCAPFLPEDTTDICNLRVVCLPQAETSEIVPRMRQQVNSSR